MPAKNMSAMQFFGMKRQFPPTSGILATPETGSALRRAAFFRLLRGESSPWERGTVSDGGNITASTRRLQNIAQGAASTTGDIVKRTARKSASRIGNIATATGTSRNGKQSTPRSNGGIRSESDRKSRPSKSRNS